MRSCVFKSKLWFSLTFFFEDCKALDVLLQTQKQMFIQLMWMRFWCRYFPPFYCTVPNLVLWLMASFSLLAAWQANWKPQCARKKNSFHGKTSMLLHRDTFDMTPTLCSGNGISQSVICFVSKKSGLQMAAFKGLFKSMIRKLKWKINERKKSTTFL